MSLINEALKRTRDATYQSATRPSNISGYRHDGGGDKINYTPRVLIIVAAFTAVAGLAWCGYFLMQKNQQTVLPVVPVKVVALPVPEPVVKPVLVVENLKTEAPTQAVVVVPPVPIPDPPKLALQGTTIEAGLKEAMINGQSLKVGDEIEDARIVSIEYRRVKLQWRDRELVLRMH